MSNPTPDPTTGPEGTTPPTSSAPPASDPGPGKTTEVRPAKDPLRHSRTSGAWVATVGASLLLVLLIVFIAQNTDSVKISFLWWDGSTPLAVALLIATVAGALITAVIGTLRILQLRRRVRKEKKKG